MNFKSRVRRLLLTGKSRFRKEGEFNEGESLAPTLLSVSSDDESSYYNIEDDPYADVRDRLESLSARDRRNALRDTHEKEPPKRHVIEWHIAFTCYMAYIVLLTLGQIRDTCAWLFGTGRYVHQGSRPSDNAKLYAPLLGNWEKTYTRRIYARIQDCFNRPIASQPGVTIKVLERVSRDSYKSMETLGRLEDKDVSKDYENKHIATAADGSLVRECLNLGSYNYLGFADDWEETCAESVHASLDNYPVTMSSSLDDYGSTNLMKQCEERVANFLGKEDALILNMGYNTNCTIIPALVSQGDLVISDSLNHTSIVNGARASGAAIRIFRHDDMDNLEAILKQAIVMGRPRTRRTWNKILVIIEGVYSMEGEYCDLRNVVRLCKKYGAYIYLDEAHSIGAMGSTGRGCTEYTGVDPADIDIMMGTFTKSFAGMGGYIAANKKVVDFLRKQCPGSAFHNSMSPLVCQQVLTAFTVSAAGLENGFNFHLWLFDSFSRFFFLLLSR
jgi:serine palmitoyltransferase